MFHVKHSGQCETSDCRLKSTAGFKGKDNADSENEEERPADNIASLVLFPSLLDEAFGKRAAAFQDNRPRCLLRERVSSLRLPGATASDDVIDSLFSEIDIRPHPVGKSSAQSLLELGERLFECRIVAYDRDFAPILTWFRAVGVGDEG